MISACASLNQKLIHILYSIFSNPESLPEGCLPCLVPAQCSLLLSDMPELSAQWALGLSLVGPAPFLEHDNCVNIYSGLYYTHSRHTIPSLIESAVPADKIAKSFNKNRPAYLVHTPSFLIFACICILLSMQQPTDRSRSVDDDILVTLFLTFDLHRTPTQLRVGHVRCFHPVIGNHRPL